METFYEMLRDSSGFDKYQVVSMYADLLKQLLDAELQVARQSHYKGNRLADLLLHKAELERDILKAQLEELEEKFRNPQPPAPNS